MAAAERSMVAVSDVALVECLRQVTELVGEAECLRLRQSGPAATQHGDALPGIEHVHLDGVGPSCPRPVAGGHEHVPAAARQVRLDHRRGSVVVDQQPARVRLAAPQGVHDPLDDVLLDVLTESSSYQPRTKDFTVSALHLMGDHPEFGRHTFTTPDPLPDNACFALGPGGPFELSPFVVVRYWLPPMVSDILHRRTSESGHADQEPNDGTVGSSQSCSEAVDVIDVGLVTAPLALDQIRLGGSDHEHVGLSRSRRARINPDSEMVMHHSKKVSHVASLRSFL
jgi:hypothetical protein